MSMLFSRHSADAVCAVCSAGLAVAALQQSRRQRQSDANEQQRLLQLTDDAKRMRERIQALEAILDAEHPNWRDK
ncbi:phage shock protein B [Klebsiella pneumoniae]|uniref:Phage shock protein B n=1 Tax=Klebsiella pneumoniae TaxID=573 RepID=A0A2X3JEG7_KLEPN|nr:phage shock protein B [Klebsiella pneumoniae]